MMVPVLLLSASSRRVVFIMLQSNIGQPYLVKIFTIQFGNYSFLRS